MNITADDPQNKQFLKKMVTLIAQVTPLADEKLTGNGSGFLILFRGKHWLVTAGHVAHAIKQAYSAGRLLGMFTCDAWTNSAGQGHGVPIPKDFAARWIILSDDHSYDVAMLELGINLAAQIQAGGVDAFEENGWASSRDNFDFYLLVGTPGEMLGDNELRRTGLQGQTIICRPDTYAPKRGVFELAVINAPDGIEKPKHERLYATIIEIAGGVKVSEIRGVSGGPVFGCNRTNKGYTTRLVAVQSGWFKERKLIVADFVETLPARFDAAMSAVPD